MIVVDNNEYYDYFCRGISLSMLDSIMKCTFGTTAYGLYMILSMAYSLKNSTSNLLSTYFHWENFQIFCERIDFWQPASSHLTPLLCTGPVHWLGNGVQANAAVARLIVRATFTWKCVKNGLHIFFTVTWFLLFEFCSSPTLRLYGSHWPPVE